MQQENGILTTNFQQRVKYAISLVGTQRNLSNKTGLSTTTISNYVNGGNEPKSHNLALIAEHTGVTVQWLLYGDEGSTLESRMPYKDEEFQKSKASYEIAFKNIAIAFLKQKYSTLSKGELETLAFRIAGVIIEKPEIARTPTAVVNYIDECTNKWREK